MFSMTVESQFHFSLSFQNMLYITFYELGCIFEPSMIGENELETNHKEINIWLINLSCHTQKNVHLFVHEEVWKSGLKVIFPNSSHIVSINRCNKWINPDFGQITWTLEPPIPSQPLNTWICDSHPKTWS